MKQRLQSSVIIAAITIASLYFGGTLLKAVLIFIGVYGSYEFIKIHKDKFNYLLFALMAAAVLCLLFLNQYHVVIMLFEIIILMSIGVFDDSESFADVSAVFLLSMMIGYALYYISYIQELNKWMIGYVVIISYMCDSFAYLIGIRFGKHKLNSKVSPKKTIEGSVGGWIFATIISFFWAMIFNFFGYPPVVFVVTSLLLPLASEIGDLSFSLVKRHYGVKDFSNLIPGHGGILDRLDSNIFCIILFGALLTLFIR
ncbi:MAG: phosphatidate cytidylyltransferase [Erysipelotrichaceae bacterium]|nr:phosphatidate cytidylyltransferase [Erysipelotrichaceae bacterium]